MIEFLRARTARGGIPAAAGREEAFVQERIAWHERPDTTSWVLELAGGRWLQLTRRRTRDAGTPDRPLRQGFLWAGEVLVEVAGPPDGDGDEPARLWGIVAVAPALEPLLDLPGRVIGEIRDAVQPGRRIATVPREAGLSVPLAFMTPHQKGAPAAPAG